MTAHAALPLAAGDEGEAVRDVQRRLVALGLDVPAHEAAVLGPGTLEALRQFQRSRGIPDDGVCGRTTWDALVEAGFRLGDRLLYLRQPMVRGDDVGALQRRLNALGFDTGRVDGIFGPDTERALREFQRNVGLVTDGICGPEVDAALSRLGARSAGVGDGLGIARVRARLQLADAPRQLADRRVAIGERGGLGALSSSIGQLAHRDGARVTVLHHPDWTEQARQANGFAAEVFIGLEMGAATSGVMYYATDGFESDGGRRLAHLLVERLEPVGFALPPAQGMQLPVLRETRMPAVRVLLAPPEQVVSETGAIADAVHRALDAWVRAPLDA